MRVSVVNDAIRLPKHTSENSKLVLQDLKSIFEPAMGRTDSSGL